MSDPVRTIRIVCRNCETSDLVVLDQNAAPMTRRCTTCGEPLEPPEPKATPGQEPTDT